MPKFHVSQSSILRQRNPEKIGVLLTRSRTSDLLTTSSDGDESGELGKNPGKTRNRTKYLPTTSSDVDDSAKLGKNPSAVNWESNPLPCDH